MINSFITYALVLMVVLGFMIFFHELGHFMAAKLFGVRVLSFALGFGKRLLHFERGGTDYRINALPFGGYVKMAGDDPSEVREGHPEEFLSRPRWQRFVIVLMGPAMNALLAVALPAGLYMFHFQKPAYLEEPARIGDVEPDSPAARAALQPGDLIVRLGGLRNPKWEDVAIETITDAGETVPLGVLRGGQVLTMTLTPRAEGPNREGYAGWYPYWPVVVDKIEPGLPAAQAGLQPGDEIVKLDGQEILYWPRFSDALQLSKGKPVELAFLRQGKELHAELKPVYIEQMGDTRWRIGVDFRRDVVVRRLPLGEAISASLKDNLRICAATFDLLGKIVTRRMSTRSLAGPIGIAQITGEAYKAGIPDLLMVVSMISLQLGIFNLLPIPVLDGGVILLLLIESVMRRDMSLEVKARVVQAGLVFLLLLAVFVMYNDIIKMLRPS